MNRFTTVRITLLCLMFLAALSTAAAQGLKAVNDTLRTGPLQTVRKNIILNDTIPGDTYSWEIITPLPHTNGTITVEGDNIVFTPIPNYNGDFDIQYRLIGSGTADTAIINIIVSEFNNPVNVIDPDIECSELMPENITFGIHEKFRTGKSSESKGNFIDGFSSPLVGDLNGDGKPEIVMLGVENDWSADANGFAIDGYYINIYNGQDGKRMTRFDLTSLGSGYGDFRIGNSYHRGASMLALADLDNDGKGEIVVTESDGSIYALRTQYNNNGTFILTKMWDGHDTNGTISFKAPLTLSGYGNNNTSDFGYPMPYIADMNADGIPEVIVYNKIFNGKTGALLMSWQDAGTDKPSSIASNSNGLSHGIVVANPADTISAKNIRNKAMTGRRPGKSSYSDYAVAVPAIVDIDGDGKQEIITGNRIHKFQLDNLTDHTQNTYTTIEGPLKASLRTDPSNSATITKFFLSDGFTRVADIDGDGELDIIVTSFINEGGYSYDTYIIIYVWDPRDQSLKAANTFYADGIHGSFSIPFIGDINGKDDRWNGINDYDGKLPEICIVSDVMYINRVHDASNKYARSGIKFHPLSDEKLRRGANAAGTAGATGTTPGWDNNVVYHYSAIASNARFTRFNRSDIETGASTIAGHIIGLTWDGTASEIEDKLKLSWGMEHSDQSSNTGITLFDFDNNNTYDLCYRDETTLRVISPKMGNNGVGSDYVDINEDENTTNTSIMFSTPVFCGTGFEYPTIADVNMDGSADILVTETAISRTLNNVPGYIIAFEYSGQKWAPCPPVWNQGMYDPTQVREDLKINARPISMLKTFTKNGETVQPYNGSWIQQPIVKDDNDFVPVVRKPDVVITDMTVKVNSGNPPTATVTLEILNRGSATVAASAPVYFYNGGDNNDMKDLEHSSQIGSKQQLGIDIFPDETKTVSFTISGNFSDQLIYACVMVDKGGVFDAGFDDCDPDNNTASGADCPYLKYTTTASPDTVLCGTSDNVLLTAVPNEPPHSPPVVYQWYRNDVPISGATSQTYTATLTGTYKCFVIDGICRDYSSPKTLTRNTPVAVDDNASASKGVQIKIPVLFNDIKSEYCNPIPIIVTPPKQAQECYVDAEGRIVYTSLSTYTGNDSLEYKIDNSIAKVRIHITALPDNVDNPNCYGTPPTTEWSIREATLNKTATVHNFGPLTVGDIDGDDTVEIIGFKPDSHSYEHDYESAGLKIFYFDKNEQTVKVKKEIPLDDHVATFGAMAIARYNDIGYIVVSGVNRTPNANNHYLYAYNAETGDKIWRSSDTYYSLSGHFGSIVSIADFDGDGKPEVYTGNSIFSLATGARKCYGGDKGNRGQLYKYSGGMSLAADIDNDSKLELCAGDTVYTVDFVSGKMTKKYALTSPLPTHAHHDGATLVADIDNDGDLEIIVVSKAPNSSGVGQNNETVVYVWKPDLSGNGGGTLLGHFTTPSSEYYGIPMIGNIDSDPYPEIVFVGTGTHIYALEYDDTSLATNKIKPKWTFPIVDPSSCTGMSLFDFNHDKASEIVYRDPKHLYIIGGNGTKVAEFNNVFSGTLREFPVIADIDDDGQAEIVVTGRDTDDGQNNQNGYIRVFKSDGSPWAPARKVWNQYAYNAVNIHENLTVPAVQFNIAGELPANSGNRPFNAFMQQQTYIDENGEPFMLTPDVFFTETPTFYHAVGDSLIINLSVKNTGDAALQAPFYISTYTDGGVNMSIDSSAQVVGTGDTKHVTATIRNFSGYLPMTSIIVVVNNRGEGISAFQQQIECNYDNNDTIFYYSGSLLLAHSDTASTITVTPVVINVTANDSIPHYCSDPAIDVIVQGKHGNATVMDENHIQYTANAGFVGRDTITYRITCGANTSTAEVYVIVHYKPDNIVEEEDCSEPAEPFEFKIKQQWSNDEAGQQNTGVLVGDLDNDGLPEIVAYDPGLTKINVYNGQNGDLKGFIDIVDASGTGGWQPTMTAVLVDADRNGMGEIITLTKTPLQLMSYEADNTGGVFKLTPKWDNPATFTNPTGTTDPFPQPIVADFNGDGIAELVVYNQIYNAVTGVSLGQTEAIATAHKGCDPGRLTGWNIASNFQTTADIDGDGLPEIVAGGKVYKVTLNAAKNAVTCSPIYSDSRVPDGFTSVADINMDGNLDIVVASTSVNTVSLYVWSPLTSWYLKNNVYTSSSGYPAHSYPFIGDIDGVEDPVTGKKYPEICLVISRDDHNTGGYVLGYKYISTGGTLNKQWILETTDISGGTGITLFDFNNDGINELVYRDQTLLRVLNAEVGGTTFNLADAGASIECNSGTALEYPVIADTDGDGSANICVTCSNAYGGSDNYLRVYESGSKPWAPTRKVWNQVNYEPLQINEDLTVPTFPIPKNTEFAGKYPYNGALIQVPTMVNEQFTVLRLSPDPAVLKVSIEEVDATKSKVCVDIENRGIKNTNPTLPVSLYKGAITLETPAGGADWVETKPVGDAILQGKQHTLCFEIDNADLSPQMSIRIQDDGTKFLAEGSYLDCDSTNNVGTVSSLLAVTDYVVTTNKETVFNVLDNDYFGTCNKGQLTDFDTVANSGLKYGTLDKIPADSSFRYTPEAHFLGVDSLTYYIKCTPDSSAAKVYILVQKPLAQQYFACPDATITIGFDDAITGVEYYWYDAPSAGSSVHTGAAYTLTKGSPQDIGTWWVEARVTGKPHIVFPRYRVDLNLGDCQVTDPAGCAADGTVLFKEDFGGNTLSHPPISQECLNTSIIDYTCNNPGERTYFRPKQIPVNSDAWHNGYGDHTTSDVGTGYMLFINGNSERGKFYEYQINDLCPNTSLYFSTWLANACRGSYPGEKPLITFELLDTDENVLAVYNTGIIPAYNIFEWRQYGFQFNNTDYSSIKMRIYEDGSGANGNDFVLDDIEIRFCAPPVRVSIDDQPDDQDVCLGATVNIGGTYTDDGSCVFGNELGYKLMFRPVGSATWTEIGASTDEIICTDENNRTLTVGGPVTIDRANEGYYRLFVSSAHNMANNPNYEKCSAASDSILVKVIETGKAADIRIDVCPAFSEVYLTRFLDSLAHNTVSWTKMSVAAPDIINPRTGEIGGTNLAGTFKYKYSLTSNCGTSSAIAYLHPLKNRFTRHIDTIVICKDEKQSRSVHLNQILGIKIDGEKWTYDDLLNPDGELDPYIKTFPTSSSYEGALIFDAYKAYSENPGKYGINYRGDTNAKAFVFQYKADNTCIGDINKKIVIVITEKMF